MAVSDLAEWLDDFCAPANALCIKRLSSNDTLANGTHQAGPYIPKAFLFSVFPMINRIDERNPDHWFELAVDMRVAFASSTIIPSVPRESRTAGTKPG